MVTVNVPICFFCIANLGRGNPYNSPAGMKAVVRALPFVGLLMLAM